MQRLINLEKILIIEENLGTRSGVRNLHTK